MDVARSPTGGSFLLQLNLTPKIKYKKGAPNDVMKLRPHSGTSSFSHKLLRHIFHLINPTVRRRVLTGFLIKKKKVRENQ